MICIIALLGLYILPIIIILIRLYIIAEPGDSLWDVLCEEDLEDVVWFIFVPLINYAILGTYLKNYISSKRILSKFVKGKKKK